MRLRVATYNVHKCKGLDRRTAPSRIAAVLQSINADIIGLQEILDVRSGKPIYDQARSIASELPGYGWCFGSNRPLLGGDYGNMLLSRLPINFSENHDLTHAQRERRGALRADIELTPGRPLHVFNVHLGTGFMERRHQARQFIALLKSNPLPGPRVIMGDFNEWTRGLASQGLSEAFETFRPSAALGQSRTYPGLLPFLHLDHFYFDRALRLDGLNLVRSAATLIASDHLPLVADFSLAD